MPSHSPPSLAESPFREYLHTNYVPADPEVQQIRAHLVPHEAELARLESLIHELAERRDRVKKYIEPHKALVSLPRRLPQDVVEEIFLACLPTHHNAIMSAETAPLLLGRICSAWRSIAFSMLRLWASLHVSVDFIHPDERTAAFARWLGRSAHRPLSLSVAYSDENIHKNDAVTKHLIRSSGRCFALHLSNLEPDIFFQLAGVNAPLLEDVQITFRSPLKAEQGPHVLSSSLFRGMRFGMVSITGSGLESLVPTTPFTWDHLTQLTLVNTNIPVNSSIPGAPTLGDIAAVLSSDSLYRLLQGCRRLRSLQLNIGYSGVFFLTNDPRPLLLPSLVHLTIRPDRSATYELFKLLSHLIMPNLVQLSLAGAELSRAYREPLARLAQCSPILSDLSLDVLDPSLLLTLQSFPCLVKLRVVTVHSGRMREEFRQPNPTQLFTTLIPSVAVPNPFPELIELITESRHCTNYEVLFDFLQKNLDYGTSLRRFRLHFQCGPPKTLPDVQSFVDRGLDVSLTYTAVVDDSPKPWTGIDQ
ncbi:hypothetical protein DFH06DRAFT_1197914 [Mycena polygramma]|nr:hypothetical protein DFH06DRAFT_1197914 [Mycena polygramma]